MHRKDFCNFLRFSFLESLSIETAERKLSRSAKSERKHQKMKDERDAPAFSGIKTPR